MSNPKNNGSGNQYSHFYPVFLIKRRATYFHCNISFPLFVLTFISFSVYGNAYEPEAIALSLLLTNGAYKLVVSISLPNVFYRSVLDIYIFFAFLMICFVFLHVALAQNHRGDNLGYLLATVWILGNVFYGMYYMHLSSTGP